jgi:hypothetical protein
MVATGSTAYHSVPAGCVASPAACIVATGASIANSTAITNPAAIAYSTAISVISAAIAVVATTSPGAVIPRAGADKDSADEPARSVVPIGRAGVGIIVVVAPRTDRSWVAITVIPVPVAATNPNPDTDLSVSGSRQ